jgi:hypothetical protein
MEKEELKQYLRDNLSVSLSIEHIYMDYDSKALKVKISLEDEVITEDYVQLPKD